MNIEDYGPNSNKYKAEQQNKETAEKRVQKVVTGPVTTRKNELRKLTDIFAPGDVNNVKSYIIWDVVIPAIKDAIEDVITNGTRMILRGDTGPRDKYSSQNRFGYVDYTKRSGNGRPYQSDVRPRTAPSYKDIILHTRGEAEYVLDQMRAVIEQYTVVRVADLYDLVGETGSFTDNKYGWTNLSNATVERVREGYLLKLPRAMPID